MWRKILKRIVLTIITLFIVSIISFGLIRLAGGDPARLVLPSTATDEEIQLQREKMGLDKSYLTQYVTYMSGILKGDLGYSYQYNMDCSVLIFGRLKETFKLVALGAPLALLVGLALGVIAGTHKNSIADVIASLFALLGQAMSPVWLCLLLILVFGVKLKILPTQGYGDLKHMILPAICVGFGFSSSVTRQIRSGMIDVLSEDYITATRARGIRKLQVYTKYALKNTIIPIITMGGSMIGGMFAGDMVVESLFGWPGLGQLTISAIGLRDLQLVQSILLVGSTISVSCILLTDIIYTIVDRRISFN